MCGRNKLFVRINDSPPDQSPLEVQSAVSYREQLQAAPTHTRLPFGMEHRRFGFFFKQRWKHQQRNGRCPGQSGRLIRSASEIAVQRRHWKFIQCFAEQPVFQTFKFGFVIRSKRRRRNGPDFEPCFGSESCRHPSVVCIHFICCFLSVSPANRDCFVKQKTRD